MPDKPTIVIQPVVKTVTVECTPEEAFEYFTADFGRWWPITTHSCIAQAQDRPGKNASCRLEQRQGGRIIEQWQTGEEFVWGTVVAWEPPERICFTWHAGQPENVAQMVEVRFLPVAAGAEIILTHSGWEVLGEKAEAARDLYNQGWESVLCVAYARYIQNRK